MKKVIYSVIALSLLTGFAEFDGSNKNITKAKLHAFNPAVKVKPVWYAQVGGGSDKEYLRLKPLLNHGRIYSASHNGSVKALNTKTSDPIWQTDIDAKITSGVGFGDDLIFVGTPDGDLIALTQQHGMIKWKAKLTGDIIAPATANGGKVFVKTASGTLYALDGTTGKILWEKSIMTPELMLRANSTPTVAGNAVIVGYSDGEVMALDTADGKEIWKVQMPFVGGSTSVARMIDVAASPRVDNGKVYVVSYHGSIKALDVKTGKEVWAHELSSYSGMTIKDKKLYITDTESHVWAFNADNGKVLWHQDELFGRELTSPTVVGKYLVLGDSEGYVHWLSRQDGRFVARLRADSSPIYTAPIAHEKQVYVYTSKGELVKYFVM